MVKPIKILCVCGTRPNFIKIAPIMRAMQSSDSIIPILINTGQHYNQSMSDVFFKDLNIPKPDINLYIKGAEPHIQSVQIIVRFNYVIDLTEPDYILVTGDVTSSFACAYTAYHRSIPIIHIEAGQRSYDNSMPEEINRVAIDHMSEMLFVSRPSGYENLLKENIVNNIYQCGNVLYDSLAMVGDNSDILHKLNVIKDNYNVLTLHRPANVDNIDNLRLIIAEIEKIATDKPVIFPVHPRIQRSMLNIHTTDNIILTEPLSYTEFINLIRNANMVITDSGGIQEETSILNIPCLTLRTTTEWTESLIHGTNRLIKDYKNIYNTYSTPYHPMGYTCNHKDVAENIIFTIVKYHRGVI